MGIYITLFLLCIVPVIFMGHKKKGVFFSLLVLSVFYSIRDLAGIDDLGYIRLFSLVNSIDDPERYTNIEQSFIYISKLFSYLGFNYKGMFLFYAVMSFLFLYLALNNIIKSNLEWSVVLSTFFPFVFLTSLTLMRQFLASVIFLFAIILFTQGKKIKSHFSIVISAIFHNSSIISFPTIYIFNYKLKNWQMALVPLIFLVLNFLGVTIFMVNTLSILVPSKYLVYLSAVQNNSIGFLHIVIYIVFIFNTLVLKKYINLNKSEQFHFINMGVMLYLCIYFFTLSAGWLSRLSIIFLPFLSMIFLPYLYLKGGIKEKYLYATTIITLNFLIFLYQMYTLPLNVTEFLFPYKYSLDFLREGF